MTKLKMSGLALVIAALSCLPIYGGITTWSENLTSVTSAYVAESTHGINSPYLGVWAQTSSGPVYSFTYTVDASHDVTVTFNTGVTFTGTLYIAGAWPSGDTSPGLSVQVGSLTSNLLWCANCATSAQRQTWGGQPYEASDGAYVDYAAYTGTASVFVYLSIPPPTCNPCPYTIVYGFSPSAMPAPTSSSNASIVGGITAFPSGVIPFATATLTNGVFSNVVDKRPSADSQVMPDPIIIIL